MLKKLTIRGFRCFSFLDMANLARVNLVVGANNAGKTCLLDALELLATGSPASLQSVSNRRSELIYVEINPNAYQGQIDVRLLFHGRSADPGSSFSIVGENGRERLGVSGQIVAISEAQPSTSNLLTSPDVKGTPSTDIVPTQPVSGGLRSVEAIARALHLSFSGGGADSNVQLLLGRNGGVLPFASGFSSRPPVRYIPPGSVNIQAAAQYWGMITARREEDLVLESLRIIEPALERIALVPMPGLGIFARLKGVEDRVPLGNLGDGILHILTLATQLVAASGGTLLVDEIDTGLHFSVLAKVWKLILANAHSLNVQVFATTHSDDCLRSLAEVLKQDSYQPGDVALHRIEKKASATTVHYSPSEIITSAERGIEVR